MGKVSQFETNVPVDAASAIAAMAIAAMTGASPTCAVPSASPARPSPTPMHPYIAVADAAVAAISVAPRVAALAIEPSTVVPCAGPPAELSGVGGGAGRCRVWATLPSYFSSHFLFLSPPRLARTLLLQHPPVAVGATAIRIDAATGPRSMLTCSADQSGVRCGRNYIRRLISGAKE